MVTDLFGREVVIDATVAVSRQVGYSVGQYAAKVVDVYEDKQGHTKVKVKYTGAGWSIPDRAQSVGLDKVVVVLDSPVHFA